MHIDNFLSISHWLLAKVLQVNVTYLMSYVIGEYLPKIDLFN